MESKTTTIRWNKEDIRIFVDAYELGEDEEFGSNELRGGVFSQSYNVEDIDAALKVYLEYRETGWEDVSFRMQTMGNDTITALMKFDGEAHVWCNLDVEMAFPGKKMEFLKDVKEIIDSGYEEMMKMKGEETFTVVCCGRECQFVKNEKKSWKCDDCEKTYLWNPENQVLEVV